MKYRLTIEQFQPNEKYEAELMVWKESRRYHSDPFDRAGEPALERVVKVLTVEVTDVEFAAIKKAALATMA